MRSSVVLVLSLCAASLFAQQSTLTIDQTEMAGISGFRAYWDRPVVVREDGATRKKDHGRHGGGLVADWSTDQPGAPVFDAIHRSLLVRFPDAATRIAEELKKGKNIAKIELVFPFVDTEYFPLDYMMPAGMSFLGDLWVRVKPQWHAVAWVLRKPWQAHPKLGPTFNASVSGRRYWKRFGAQDTSADRHAQQFGPTEVSYKVTSGRMDITACLRDEAFGNGLAERLRALSDCGFIVRKWETYDARFNHGGYEYGGAPGGRGIRVKAPGLVVTFGAGKAKPGELPAAPNVSKLPKEGRPTAIVPSDRQIGAFIDRFKIRKPEYMQEWQWRRVEELFQISGRRGETFPESREAYLKWLDHYLSQPYRQFRGHHTPLSTHAYLLYREAMPKALREHFQNYWSGWLMPGRPYWELQHNQWGIFTKPENSYYARTGDWRGNHSFYRESYTRYISTMNFNHLAVMAALLGGSIIDDPEPLSDGRYGLENLLLRLWSWYDGTTQESIDHYYLGLSLLNQKSFLDLAPERFDRMIGRSILTKTVEELAGCYHPAFKRFVTTSGRTGVAYVLAINEGPNAILHTISRRGAMHDAHNPDRMGMPVCGHDLPPDLVARQAVIGPWAPAWMGRIVDEKPLPFELTATFKQWGAYEKTPLWKRSFLGRHYGIASLDVATGNQTVPVMAQWRRSTEQADRLQEVGTLLMRYGINWTEFYDSLYHGSTRSNANGSVGTQGGHTATFQHRNKAIVFMSPFGELKFPGGRPIPKNVHSLQSSIALANYAESPAWRVFVDGKEVLSGGVAGERTPTDAKSPAEFRTPAFSIKAKQTSRITIQDGVSFIGIIPIPSTDLGRTEEIVITDGGEPVAMQGGGKAAPTLVINNYNLYNAKAPLDRKNADWKKVNRAYGGFVVEVADLSEYESFAAFQKHIQAAALGLDWNDGSGLLEVKYRSGPDVMECAYRPEYEGSWNRAVPSDRCFPYRRVNGRWPYLPKGLERDTTVSQQGRTGRLEKNQAALTFQPGHMGYLLTEPSSGTYVFSNPLPDAQYLVMDIPGGARIKADGKLGLLHLTASPEANRIEFEYAEKNQVGAKSAASGMATSLFVFGWKERPRFKRNGDPASNLRLVEVEGAGAWVIPLAADSPYQSAGELERRYRNSALEQLAALSALGGQTAELRTESGPGHFLTEPRAGVYEFPRQWPTPSVLEATAPGGLRIASDGKVAFLRLLIDTNRNRIELDYPPYAQVDKEDRPIADRAKALLVFGVKQPPSALLHGKDYKEALQTVKVDQEAAWLIPLFGDEPKAIKEGIEARYRAALKVLGE